MAGRLLISIPLKVNRKKKSDQIMKQIITIWSCYVKVQYINVKNIAFGNRERITIENGRLGFIETIHKQ